MFEPYPGSTLDRLMTYRRLGVNEAAGVGLLKMLGWSGFVGCDSISSGRFPPVARSSRSVSLVEEGRGGWMKAKQWMGVLKQSFTEFGEDKVLRLSAALSYYAIFSIAP